jgi:hypothetical protein
VRALSHLGSPFDSVASWSACPQHAPPGVHAGMKEGGQVLLGGLHVKVSRNFFGSQVRCPHVVVSHAPKPYAVSRPSLCGVRPASAPSP